MRVGIGEDIHRVDASRPLFLGGVEIQGAPGLAGHSDADVLLHAVTDAVLGAAALGDIGTHFPPSDPRWAGAASAEFLSHAITLAAEAGWAIANVDTTVRAEHPRLAPYVSTIRNEIAALTGVAAERVSVKATTNEGLDAVGRGEAIAASAIVLLESR